MLAMAHPETVSRQALDGYTFVWRAFRETGSPASVAYPVLEASQLASFSRLQTTVGRASDASRDAAQPTPPSLSSSQSTPRHTLPAQDIRQLYPNVYMEPQHYYDATRHRQSPSHPHPTPLSSFMFGPYPPSVSPPGTAFATNTMSESLLASLRALQYQFTEFQESLGGVKSDVQDVLSQLHVLCTAQNKTDKSIAELEGVIGVSSTGTASKGRGRRGRGRARGGRAGIHTELTLEGVEAIVPEKTLVQSLASIQSGLEQLLAHESRTSQFHPSLSRQEATSPPHFPPSVNPAEQESSRTSSPSPSFVDPSQQYSTLQLTQSASAISSTSQSDSSSSSSSIAILTPEFGTSPQPATLGKEYVDMSIQACPPSPMFEPSCSLSHSQRHTPGFTLVDWNVDPATLGRSSGSPARLTAYTAEYRTHFVHDTDLPSATNSVTDSQSPRSHGDCPLRSSTVSYAELPTRTMSAPSLSSYPSEPGTHNATSQRVRSTVLLAASSSPDTSAIPSVGSTSPAAETPSSPTRIFHQNPLLQTSISTIEGINSSVTSPGFGPPGNSQTPLTSQSSSLSSTDDTPISVSGASASGKHEGCLVQPRAKSDSEDVQMTSSTDREKISATGGVKMTFELKLAAPAHRQPSSPVEADDTGLTSGLPTPPSETFANDHVPRVVSRSTREHGAATDQTLISRASLRRNLPVIPTPPSLTPEPSSGEDRGTLDGRGWGSTRQRSSMAFSEPLSPLTPPLPSPSPAVGSLLSEEGSSDMGGQAAAQKVMEEPIDSTEDARGTVVRGGDVTEGVRADVSMINNEKSSARPHTDQAGVDESISTTNSAVANEDSSRVPQGPSVGQPSIKLPEHHPDANGIVPAYLPIDGNDFGFSSPWRRPLSTPAPPSQYATPSDSSGPDPCPTQEENEVWSALMLDASGMSTPPDSASFPLHHPSRASSVHPHSLQQFSISTSTYTNDSGVARASSTLPLGLLAVDPSVLHGLTPTVLTHAPGSASVPPALNGSLSPLTSLDDTDVGCPHGRDAPRRRKKPRATAPADRPRGSSSRGRRSHPYHAPSSSRAAAAENLNGRVVGGPSPSVDELVLLARRRSSKINPRLPESVRGVKRKRGVVDGRGEGDGEEGRQESEGADSRGELMRPGSSIPVDDDASREGQGEVVSIEVSANVPTPGRIGVVGSALGTPMPIVSRLAPESSTSSGLVNNAGERPDVASCLPVSGKRTKKQSERGKEAHAARMASEQARARQKERKRASKAKPNSLVKYHVRNGQIVALEPEPEPRPEPRSHVQAPVTPSVSKPSVRSEGAAQESRTATGICHQEGRENKAMKAPLSLPAISSHPTPHSARCVKLSPTKVEVWNTISQDGATWPELPSMFSHWDAQFIQCDNCDMWFHYGCVAVMPGDPRLEPEALFICAMCQTQSARRQTLRNHNDTCARPDCPEPQVTDGAELYFVEKLVGRKKIEGYVYVWLAKWEGFPMTQASWIPKENVVGDGTRLFSAFLKDARGEGADLSQDVVLLKEALEAGWKAC